MVQPSQRLLQGSGPPLLVELSPSKLGLRCRGRRSAVRRRRALDLFRWTAAGTIRRSVPILLVARDGRDGW
jgi:hypothetical protein